MLVKGAPGHISPELTPIANTLGSMLTLSRRSISNRCRSQGLCYPGRLKGCRWNQRLYAGQSDQGMQPLSRDSSLFQIRRVVHLFFQGYGDFTTIWMDSSLIITIIAAMGHFIFYAVSCYMGILLRLFIAIIYRYSFTFFTTRHCPWPRNAVSHGYIQPLTANLDNHQFTSGGMSSLF